MDEQKFCQSCNQSRQCREVYRQLGGTKSPSVVFKIVAAFLLPLLVFIASLAAFESILAKAMNAKGLVTAASCILALFVTLGLILIIKIVNNRLSKNR